MTETRLFYAEHALRGNGGRNALVILEGKIKGKKAKGRPKRMWFVDIRQWTMLKDYRVKLNKVLRIVSLGGHNTSTFYLRR